MAETSRTSDADAVLSSVRRIVASGSREDTLAETETRADIVSDKLLLTPSLRVDTPKPAGDTATFFHSPRRYSKLETRIAELERAVSTRADSWEPDGSETTDEETPKSFVFSHEPRIEDVPEERPADEALAPEMDRLVLGGPIETPTTLEDVVEARSGAALEPQEATARPTAQEGRVDGIMGDMSLQEADIDEEALRALISHLVRAELQGELGEKITRNVRKLVRREIHRVLLTHDFG